eukprot:UN08430
MIMNDTFPKLICVMLQEFCAELFNGTFFTTSRLYFIQKGSYLFGWFESPMKQLMFGRVYSNINESKNFNYEP